MSKIENVRDLGFTILRLKEDECRESARWLKFRFEVGPVNKHLEVLVEVTRANSPCQLLCSVEEVRVCTSRIMWVGYFILLQ